jgi:hypothetical protein
MITDEQIADGCNKAYLKAGHNAYFGNGFEAGVKFALEQVKNLSSKPMLADSKTILHRCSCEEGNPVEVKICLNCDGILE